MVWRYCHVGTPRCGAEEETVREMTHITDVVLRRAVADLPRGRFDSHDLFRAIMRVAPQEYALELERCANMNDLFEKLHPQIARRLAESDLTDVARATGHKQVSTNIRGRESRCEVWDTV